MKVALLGLLESGKSTLLSAISGRKIPAAGATQIEEAIIPVPDERLDWLASLYKPSKTVHAAIDCLDVPGLCFTDEHSRLAAHRLINQIRTVDMLVLVVRAFESRYAGTAVPPYRNSVNPRRDLAELQSEIILADLELVATRVDRLEKQIRKPTATHAHDKAELALQKRLQEALEAEKPISTVIQGESEMDLIRSFGFLTLKPITVVVNVGENQLDRQFDFSGLIDISVPVTTLSAKLENELSQLDAESRQAFMSELGLTQRAANKFVNSCYAAMGLISFITTCSDEVHAWPVRHGTMALDAAGKVHTDMKRGFIRAETMAFADLKELGSEKAVKAAGKMRLEGKQYVVQDGDIIKFRFNV